jgi:ABC-type polysaccharide/polyol phosphate transport system ATPase subunit
MRVKLHNVSEIYSFKFWTPEKVLEEPVHALRNLSLEISHGESLCVIGENGAGKTTLIKVIAGLIDPTLGQVTIEGQTGVIMDLGCGFHPDLTGRENCLSAAPLYGKSKTEIQKILPDIEHFAELGRFFHAPIRTYSHGMRLRLAFAFAIHLKPDILCIDDILMVGDEKSRYRCFKKVEELRESGISVLLVTHDLPLALQFAPRTLWLKEGQVCRDGPSQDVVNAYLQFCQNQKIEVPSLSNPLYWTEKNTLCFKTSPLTCLRNWNLEIADGEKTHVPSHIRILEMGRTFLRGSFLFKNPHFSAELILSILENNSFRVELFLENPLAVLSACHWKLHCPWEIPWDRLELTPPIDSFLSVTQMGACWSSEKNLGFQWCFDPLLSFQKQEPSCWTLSASSRLPPYPSNRSRLCALSFSILEKTPSFPPSPLLQELSQDAWTLQQIGYGFRLSKNGTALLNLLGIEILFDYQGHSCASSSASAEIVPVENSRFIFQHPQWPVSFLLSIRFKKDCLVLHWETQFKIPVRIRNLRFQIFWNSAWTLCERPTHQAKNAPLTLKNGSATLCVQIDSKRSWLLAHTYTLQETKALVTTLFDPEPKLPQQMKILWNPLPVLEELSCEQSILFHNGACFIPPLLTGWHHYLSLFSSPLWHDSLQALWTQDGPIHRGPMPWIPVELECEMIHEKNSIHIGWRIHVLEKIRLEKVQLCFPIKNEASDLQEKIEGARLRFPFLKTLENTSTGQKSLNFTWLCDPIFLEPGVFDLGWITLTGSP